MLRAVAPYPSQPPVIIGCNILLAYAYIVLPYLKNESLINFLLKAEAQNRVLSRGLRMHLYNQMLLAVHDLHSRSGIAHNDLKPDNFVITDEGNLALIDFAHASAISQMLRVVTGTTAYTAPEVRMLVESGQTEYLNYSAQQSDMWQLGVNLFIALSGKLPYGKLSDGFFDLIKARDIEGFFRAHNLSTISPILK